MAEHITSEDRRKAHQLLVDAASKMKAAISEIHAMGFNVNYVPIRRQINKQYTIVNDQQHHRQAQQVN